MGNISYQHEYIVDVEKLIKLIEDMLPWVNEVSDKAYNVFYTILKNIKQEMPIYETTL